MKIKTSLAVFLVAGLRTPAPAQTPLPGRIGVAAVVRGQVQAKPTVNPEIGRILSSGQPVFLNDKISTAPDGRLQILFQDETVLTLGPNTTVILDKFIYDSNSGAGEISANVIKGIFRFISGRIARNKPNNMKIRLPAGILGVFGTMGEGQVKENSEATVVFNGPGIKNNVGESLSGIALENPDFPNQVVVSRPGFGSSVSPGEPPSLPFEASRETLRDIAAQLSLEAAPQEFRESKESKGAPIQAGPVSPEQASGQDRARGNDNFREMKSIAKLEQDKEDLSSGLAQTLIPIPNSVNTWEQLRGVSGGTGQFSGSGSFSGCGGGCNGSWNFSLAVNFATRIIQVQAQVQTIPFTNTLGLTEFSYDNSTSFTGNTVFVRSSNNFAPAQPGAVVDYNFSFNNKDGVVAKQVEARSSYSDPGPPSNGTGSPIFSDRQ
ncbi:MAG: FecR domain-containing protein [Elusimicrobia bacterium]|nr:FecR domain-containing protein [Elusimicrobiota bacterium]